MSGGEGGVLWVGGSGGVGVGVTCSAGPCPQALGLPPLSEVGNQPQPGLGLGTEARPPGHGAPALHVGFRRREGSLGLWCVCQFVTLRRRGMA